jgi:hypothetical protein
VNELYAVCSEFVEDPSDNRDEIADMHDLDTADTIVLVGVLNTMLKARARAAQLKGARLIIVGNPDDRYNRYADESYAAIDTLKLERAGTTVFVYNRESTPPAVKKAVWDRVGQATKEKVWVNSDYMNLRGIDKFKLPVVKELAADNVICFGPLPDNVDAEKVFRLPLKAFHIKGSVTTDTGEEITL